MFYIYGIMFFLLAPVSFADPKTPELVKELPYIKSAAALVVDLGTGEVLFSRDPDVARPIASISKLMGALVIQKYCALKPDELHKMSVENRDAAKGGDKTKLITGWSYSHGDLLKAALMRSDNRALPALGEACGLSIEAFAEKMNAEAKLLGLKLTTFKEPNGLSKENMSTPREIMVFLREAIKIPELSVIMNTKESEITGHRDSKSRIVGIRNTDRLLSKDLASILGGKTGYTDIARYCLAIAARTEDNRELGMVFLGAEGKLTRFADFTRVIRWLVPAKAFAGEAVKATATGDMIKKPEIETQDMSLPVNHNPSSIEPQLPKDAPGIENGGAAMKPQELFEYYW